MRGGKTPDPSHDKVPDESLEVLRPNPAELLTGKQVLQKLLKDCGRILNFIRREDDLCECEQSTDTDVVDDGTGGAALEADGVYPGEDMVVDVLEQLCVDEAEGGLNDPQNHIGLPVLALEEEDDVDDVVHDVGQLLAVELPLEHLILAPELLLLDDLDEGDDLGEDAEDAGAEALEVDDVEQVGEDVLDDLEGVPVGAEEELVDEGIVGLGGRGGTSAECLLRGRSALLRFLRSLME